MAFFDSQTNRNKKFIGTCLFFGTFWCCSLKLVVDWKEGNSNKTLVCDVLATLFSGTLSFLDVTGFITPVAKKMTKDDHKKGPSSFWINLALSMLVFGTILVCVVPSPPTKITRDEAKALIAEEMQKWNCTAMDSPAAPEEVVTAKPKGRKPKRSIEEAPNLDSGMDVYASDIKAYTLFAPLFNPIIQKYHSGFAPDAKQPAKDLGEANVAEFPNLDPEGAFINSTSITIIRSLQEFPFNLSLHNYIEVEGKVKKILTELKDQELAGTYYPLKGMTKDVQKALIKDHFLFKEGDRFLKEANAYRFWPNGRGIYHNKAKTFLVWVNEEDHLRIISMQNGGDVGAVLARLIRGVKAIEEKAPFARDERLGYLTFCPSNLCPTVRASVHIKLPKISAKPDFKEVCDGLKLQIRGIYGEHSDSAGGVYDISARLGLTEYEAVKEMYDGIKQLIELEKAAA